MPSELDLVRTWSCSRTGYDGGATGARGRALAGQRGSFVKAKVPARRHVTKINEVLARRSSRGKVASRRKRT